MQACEQRPLWYGLRGYTHLSLYHLLLAVRFFESSRIEWMVSLAREIGASQRVADMLAGRGVSLILKSISIDYKRPVVYPDTLLVAHKPHLGASTDSAKRLPKTHFHLKGAVWSYAQRRVVTTCDSVLVWYDYDKLAKCDPGGEARRVLEGRIRLGA